MKTINWIKNNWKIFSVIILSIILGMIIGKAVLPDSRPAGDEHDHEVTQNTDPTIYTCSMHPQVRKEEPGLCPICAMDLVPLNTVASTDDGIGQDEIQMSASAVALANIQTVRVKRGVPVKTIHLTGKVKPDERNIAEIAARFGGRIETLFVNFTGQHVKKGQKLLTIYSPELITAQQELLEAAKYRETNPSFYKASRNKLKLWDLTEKQIEEIELSGKPAYRFDILSPISGTVTGRNVSVGDYVHEGSLLLEIIDLKKLWVMFDAYESDLSWIKKGDPVTFTLQSVPEKTFTSRVSYIDPFIDPETRVAQVRVEVSNPEFILKPEMFAKGVLESKITYESDQLLIPKSAVLWTGKRGVVYVKVPDREMPSFQFREIVLGPEAGNEYVVASGLEEGEEIAMNGVFKIDAAAQLAGKSSMMNPKGGKIPTGHDHGEMDMSTHQAGMDQNVQKEQIMITVYGNCGMCKDRIEETARAQEGVLSAKWESKTQKLHLAYDANILDPMDVEKAIAAVGHDTENQRAPDSVYENLPGCCLYDRHGK